MSDFFPTTCIFSKIIFLMSVALEFTSDIDLQMYLSRFFSFFFLMSREGWFFWEGWMGKKVRVIVADMPVFQGVFEQNRKEGSGNVCSCPFVSFQVAEIVFNRITRWLIYACF